MIVGTCIVAALFAAAVIIVAVLIRYDSVPDPYESQEELFDEDHH